MFCQQCGKQLSDDARFCIQCGQPQGNASSASSQRWEHCKIIYNPVKMDFWFPNLVERWRFEAEAITSKGTYIAGKSGELKWDHAFSDAGGPTSRSYSHKAACDALMQKLIQEGWELTGEKGEYWWNYKFRRPLK